VVQRTRSGRGRVSKAFRDLWRTLAERVWVGVVSRPLCARKPGCSSLVLSLLGVPTSGCSSYEPASDILMVVEANEPALAPPGEDWSCLSESVEAAIPIFAGNERVVYSVQILDLATGRVHPDVRVRACGASDVTCDSPLAADLSVDAQGYVDIPLFRGFIGFIEITGSEIQPSAVFVNDALQPRIAPEFPFSVISLDSLAGLMQLLGLRQAPMTGLLSFRALDCQGVPAPGVTLSLEGVGQRWYFVDGLPSLSASSTGSQGIGGYINVPVGVALVEARTRDGSSVAGTQSLAVREGWMGSMFVRPRAAIDPRQ
jgi:hypothetical protein